MPIGAHVDKAVMARRVGIGDLQRRDCSWQLHFRGDAKTDLRIRERAKAWIVPAHEVKQFVRDQEVQRCIVFAKTGLGQHDRIGSGVSVADFDVSSGLDQQNLWRQWQPVTGQCAGQAPQQGRDAIALDIVPVQYVGSDTLEELCLCDRCNRFHPQHPVEQTHACSVSIFSGENGNRLLARREFNQAACIRLRRCQCRFRQLAADAE